MFLELVDALRCPAPHDETWLVASVDRFEGRYIVEGVLGCPSCRAAYPVREGVLHMEERTNAPTPGDDLYGQMDRPSEEAVVRCAALLGADESGGVFLLSGAAGRVARSLEELVAMTVILLDPVEGIPLGVATSAIRAPSAVPLAAGSLRGAIVDVATATPARLDGVARALAVGGRLVAPAQVALPAGIRELARDPHEWVGVREVAPSAPVALRRR